MNVGQKGKMVRSFLVVCSVLENINVHGFYEKNGIEEGVFWHHDARSSFDHWQHQTQRFTVNTVNYIDD